MSTKWPVPKSFVVLIVDDHPLIRSAVGEVIRLMADEAKLLEAANPPAGLALLEESSDLHLILLDLDFAMHDGLAFIERFRAAAPATPLLVYTMNEDSGILRKALTYGAVGIVPKTRSPMLLRKAIEVVMDGGIYVPHEIAQQLASSEPRRQAESGT